MSLRNVLCVLDDQEAQMWATLDAAIELAVAESARLTLVKTCAGPAWFNLISYSGWFVPPQHHELHTVEARERQLTRAVDLVPQSIPVTSLMLAADTRSSLQALLRTGSYDAFVTSEKMLGRKRRLQCELHAWGILSVAVTPSTGSKPDKLERGTPEPGYDGPLEPSGPTNARYG